MKLQSNMGPRPAGKEQKSGFDPVILREYDIRGQVGKNLGEEDALLLGKAFGTFVKAKKSGDAEPAAICVGYDGRHSSPALAEALIHGLVSTGARVDTVGLGPSPMLYFAVKDRMTDAGIMVTGSHNPPDYNGFKMCLQSGPVFGEAIQDIGRIAESGRFVATAPENPGEVRAVDVRENYVARLLKDLENARPLTIAWDAGNGAAGEVLRLLTDRMPGKHILLFDAIDGDFPNHHPDPTVDENLKDLRQTVVERGCDLGIAFDGDGDRIGVVNEKGEILRCDMLMTIYARDVLRNHPGAAVIGDIKCSQVMFDEIARLGGRPLIWKTGHSLIKDKMTETGAPLAGELSGHIFFADKYYGFDDALYCAVRLINALGEKNTLSGLTENLPALHSTPEVRFEVREDEKFELVPRAIENLRAAADDSLHMNDIDGIRVSTPDGWWLLRPSNTQSVLVARAEGTTPEGLERLKAMAAAEVARLGYRLDFPA